MKFYRGISSGDSRVVGGGAFNDDNVGSEQLNFAPYQQRVFGFVQGVGSNSLSLRRIDAIAAQSDTLPHVLVIFVARRPDQQGQVIVGWYHDAVLWRQAKRDSRKKFKHRHFNCETSAANAVLLPTWLRTHNVPSGVGAIGQSNVCYPLHADGTRKRARWMQRAIEYVDTYDGPNSVVEPELEIEKDSAVGGETAAAVGQGQGFASTPAQRAAIEALAMKRAKAYFKQRFSSVEDVSKRKGVFDLECRSGGRVVRVEVKGTTTTGDSVILTNREVQLARSQGSHALFVLHSIKLVGKSSVSGGKHHVVEEWNLRDTNRSRLVPLSYIYKLR
jgi:hypothetical protein